MLLCLYSRDVSIEFPDTVLAARFIEKTALYRLHIAVCWLLAEERVSADGARCPIGSGMKVRGIAGLAGHDLEVWIMLLIFVVRIVTIQIH